MKVATLKNWTVVKAQGAMYLKGQAYGHINPDYASDGDVVMTSRVWTKVGGHPNHIYCDDGVYKLEG